MLDPEVHRIALDIVLGEYAARSQRFVSALERVKSELAIKGLGSSGAMLEAVADLCADEVEESAERAWEILRDTVAQANLRTSADLAGDLKQVFDDFFFRCCDGPEGILNSTRMTAGGRIDAAAFDGFQRRKAGTRQVVGAKIDLFVRSLKQA